MYRTLACLVVGGVLVVCFGGPMRTRAEAIAASGRDTAAEAHLQWQGVASCASTACHHANGDRGSKQSEYTTWINHDRHARAYQVLFEVRSQQIVKNLYGNETAPAEKTALCLNCHAANVSPEQRAQRFALEDGVSCESCHGPAEKWRTVH